MFKFKKRITMEESMDVLYQLCVDEVVGIFWKSFNTSIKGLGVNVEENFTEHEKAVFEYVWLGITLASNLNVIKNKHSSKINIYREMLTKSIQSFHIDDEKYSNDLVSFVDKMFLHLTSSNPENALSVPIDYIINTFYEKLDIDNNEAIISLVIPAYFVSFSKLWNQIEDKFKIK